LQVGPEGKYLVDLDPEVDISLCTPNARVALKSDSYMLHKVLPSKVDPLVSLMRVEKVPDSTYDMVGGLDEQIRELKEVEFLCLGYFYKYSTCLYFCLRATPSPVTVLTTEFI
jgi:ATP-dependent 26S proteasome regulatory subunit